MLKKIISGGQTGAARAALDAAIQLRIPHGGWVTAGRFVDDGVLSQKYRLVEDPTAICSDRTEKNVRDSDGTLIMNHGRLTGSSKLARNIALRYDKPCLHLNLKITPTPKALPTIIDWIIRNRIEVLHVTGEKAGQDTDIYGKTYHILCSVISLCQYEPEGNGYKNPDNRLPGGQGIPPLPPRNLEGAVDRLIESLPLRDKTLIANMSDGELIPHYFTLGNYIRNHFDLWSGNQDLLDACRHAAGDQKLHPDAAAELIIKSLWRSLRKTHKLRVVK